MQPSAASTPEKVTLTFSREEWDILRARVEFGRWAGQLASSIFKVSMFDRLQGQHIGNDGSATTIFSHNVTEDIGKGTFSIEADVPQMRQLAINLTYADIRSRLEAQGAGGVYVADPIARALHGDLHSAIAQLRIDYEMTQGTPYPAPEVDCSIYPLLPY